MNAIKKAGKMPAPQFNWIWTTARHRQASWKNYALNR
jgi:hypothetical protein